MMIMQALVFCLVILEENAWRKGLSYLICQKDRVQQLKAELQAILEMYRDW